MLDARQLEALNAVIEHGGFGPAAKALSITLAAVSLRIKSLEDTLGQRLLVRGKQVRATPAGQALLGHVKQVRLMEADLLDGLHGGARPRSGVRWQTLGVAINADSVASWFLPGVAALLQRHHLLLEILIDDQDHTHDALKSGDVMGCVTTLTSAMRGCVAEPLGVMRYRCVASPAGPGRSAGTPGATARRPGGYEYDSDYYGDDLPFWTRVTKTDGSEQGHLVVPYSLDTNDMRFVQAQGFNTGDHFFTYLRDSFDALYEEGDPAGLDRPKMMSIGMHC
eukprot:gene44347-59163_t